MATGNLSDLPSASAWYMNPFFAASFGGVAALGLILLIVGYFIFFKLKFGQMSTGEKCATCGLTGDAIRTIVCTNHGEMGARLKAVEEWLRDQSDDYKELRRRVDAIERGGR